MFGPLSLVFFNAPGAVEEGPLRVRHRPPHFIPARRPDSQTLYYYSIEVHNCSDRPLQVYWFECYRRVNSRWVPDLFLRRPGTAAEFSSWFSEGVPTVRGVIPARMAAVDGASWFDAHGQSVPQLKWAFRALDPDNLEHYAEAVVAPEVMQLVTG